MTIMINIPVTSLPTGFSGTLRLLLPLLEPLAFAIAGALGAGIVAQIGLDVGLRLARHALHG